MSSQNATLAFLLGTSPDSPSVSPLVREEAARHGDLLVADFVDHYNNLTIKSLYTLKFVVSQKWKVHFSLFSSLMYKMQTYF